jgi:cyclopropane-fatty-acyl-phospholipid synthase
MASLDPLWRGAVAKHLAGLTTDELRVVEGGETRTYGAAPNPDSLSATLHVHDSRLWSGIVRRGVLGAAEAFLDGRWSADDIVALVRIFARNRDVYDGIESRWTRLGASGARLLHWLRANSRRGGRRNISAHYDLGNDFFALMLDPTWTYSCAIFESPEFTLEQAQRAKYERACRKLELGPQDHVLEIGGGWGGFAEYAAQTYGSRVTSTTVSREQFDFAKERIARAGLADRVDVIFEDYRDLEGEYDKLVSIEMIEAVGDKYLDAYFRVCSERLRPSGLALLQAIMVADRDYEKSLRTVDFISRYVFPGGQLPSLGAIHGALARVTDLRMLQLEDLTTHYVRTLAAWREKFLKNLESVRALGLPERFIRLWEFYLCYCEGGFAERATGVAQILLEKPRGRREPLLASLG